MTINIYQNPLASELVEATVTFSPALSEAPTSAVVWLTRAGVTTEHAATLQPGATTASAVVIWDPSSRLTEAGRAAYTMTIRFRNAGGTHYARSVPIAVNVAAYPSSPL